jgi:hypothetical protein
VPRHRLEELHPNRELGGDDPLKAPAQQRGASAPRTDSAVLVGAGALVLAVIALFWMFREPETTRAAPKSTNAAPPAAELDLSVHKEPPPVQHELASDNIPVMAAGSVDHSNAEPRHPHPITPEHERNFRQLNRIAQLNGAMDLGDVDELRQLNRKYREEYPEQTLYQDGYDLIADCLENRTAATRAAAERYWSTQIASNLRRYVRRHCLEGSP